MRRGMGEIGAGPLALHEVVQAVGSDDFGSCLVATLHQQLAVDQVMVFQTTERAPWRILIAQNIGNTSVAERLATAYICHFWARDPKRRVIPGLMPMQVELQASDDLCAVDADYRRTLFIEPELVDKLSLFFRGTSATYYINLYRGASAGFFGRPDFDRLRLTCDLLSALVEKHATLIERSPTCTVTQMEGLFRAVQPKLRARLSSRELETCARVVLGYSSEAIAIDLGVSVHSAITFRKRAFVKFGITTHQELFAVVLHNRRFLDR